MWSRLLALGWLVAVLPGCHACAERSGTCDTEPGEATRLVLSASGASDTHGATAAVTAVLAEAPTSPVTVHFVLGEPEFFALVPEEVVFTKEDFDQPHVLTLSYRPGSGVAPSSALVAVDRVTTADPRFDCFQPNVSTAHVVSGCGDGVLDPGEECDRPLYSTPVLTCAYGEATCQRCDVSCRLVPGSFVGRCGDGLVSKDYEGCEGDAGTACAAFQAGTGDVSCNPQTCQWDLSACRRPTDQCFEDSPCWECVGRHLAHACVLAGDGGLTCWGSNAFGQATPPPGQAFVEVVDTAEFSCGRRVDGSVTCWGDPAWAGDRGGAFSHLAGGLLHACGVRMDGGVDCWGQADAGAATPPPGLQARGVAAGLHHSCALTPSGQARCWGYDVEGQSAAPSVAGFVDLAAGAARSCGLLVDGGVRCWGGGSACTDPPGAYRSLFGGPSGIGGVRSDGELRVFTGRVRSPAEPQGAWTKLSGGGGEGGCGVRPSGSIECWGPEYRFAVPPAGPYSDVAAGPDSVCGVKVSGGALTCVGGPGWRTPFQPVLGAVKQVGLGGNPNAGCALKVNGTLQCWGGYAPPPLGVFTSMVMDTGVACALRTDDSAACWGSGTASFQTPASSFKSVGVSSGAACGVRTDATLQCWGRTSFLAGPRPVSLAPPAGRFLAVALGRNAACGLREPAPGATEGEASCWGDISGGLDRAPPGRFASLFFTGDRACAHRADGTVACWGALFSEQGPHPPAGPITAARLGEVHACALGMDAGWSCWGRDTFSLTSAPGRAFQRVTAGGDEVCATDTDDVIACWKRAGDVHRFALHPALPAIDFSLGDDLYCWLDAASHRPACQGALGQDVPIPLVPFDALSVAGGGACGITSATDAGSGRSLRCFGSLTGRSGASQAGGGFAQVATGRTHVCAVHATGQALCFGETTLTPAVEQFVSVATEENRGCGVTRDAGLVCFGALDSAHPAPSGEFSGVDLSRRHGCAVRTDGGLACWGTPASAAPAAPAGAYGQVDVADDVSCAVGTDGHLSCWGWMVRP